MMVQERIGEVKDDKKTLVLFSYKQSFHALSQRLSASHSFASSHIVPSRTRLPAALTPVYVYLQSLAGSHYKKNSNFAEYITQTCRARKNE